jgi:hypothetical protein
MFSSSAPFGDRAETFAAFLTYIRTAFYKVIILGGQQSGKTSVTTAFARGPVPAIFFCFVVALSFLFVF